MFKFFKIYVHFTTRQDKHGRVVLVTCKKLHYLVYATQSSSVDTAMYNWSPCIWFWYFHAVSGHRDIITLQHRGVNPGFIQGGGLNIQSRFKRRCIATWFFSPIFGLKILTLKFWYFIRNSPPESSPAIEPNGSYLADIILLTYHSP